MRGGVVIDHAVGTVIGETSEIGKGTYILQNVILGAKGISNNPNENRHPIIGRNVEISANVKIFGNITIGDNVFLGPDLIITKDIKANTKIIRKVETLSQKKIKEKLC